MNRIGQKLLLLPILVLVLFSCKDDEDITFDPPVVSTFEMGEGSTHSTEPVAYRGKDIHMEASILAYANVESIKVSIHAHDLEVGEGEVRWDFEEVYTDAKYLVKNPDFHEHIDIPATAPAGEYHVELVITDAAGNVTEEEGHLEIRKLIHVSGFEMDAEVVRGEDFHVEFFIGAANGIHTITVDIHAHGLTAGAGEIVWEMEEEFEEGYHELSEVEFHEHIDVPDNVTAGEYHVMFIIEDEDGNEEEFDTHIDVLNE